MAYKQQSTAHGRLRGCNESVSAQLAMLLLLTLRYSRGWCL